MDRRNISKPCGRNISKDWRPTKCGKGEGWRESAGWSSGQIKEILQMV